MYLCRIMSKGRTILDNHRFELTLKRLCFQLIENYGGFENTCIIGIQKNGVRLSERVYQYLKEMNKKTSFPIGKLDITFFRDDFRIRDEPLAAHPTELSFDVEGKRVILVDDVLYTGRTIHAAIAALQQYGRPSRIELMVLVDRRFNRHFPIKADYIGLQVDSIDEAYVRVDWKETNGKDQVLFFSPERT